MFLPGIKLSFRVLLLAGGLGIVALILCDFRRTQAVQAICRATAPLWIDCWGLDLAIMPETVANLLASCANLRPGEDNTTTISGSRSNKYRLHFGTLEATIFIRTRKI